MKKQKRKKKVETKPKTKALHKAHVSGSVSKGNFSHIDFEFFREQNTKQLKDKKLRYKETKYFAFVIVSKNKRYGDKLEMIEFNTNDYRNFLLYKPTGKSKNFIPIIEPKKFKRVVVDFPFTETGFVGYNEDFYRNMSLQTGIIITPLKEKHRKLEKNYPFGWFNVKKCELLIPDDYKVSSAMAKHYR
jgi:hypothetical protein